ncbi:efflux RND transporter permease subunit [Pseudogemmobacter bohemicus]|uniref:efflux RND transporter permease subunit n=1 Tax=Pseudogemmobacter bohemicus TaxID=2250708 RepID=UPI000DD3792D|nr:efflux RND transporter permease subunit [Pseudogemmobacter bohemicus]
MFLTRISVARPVFATMVMVAIMVMGLAGWRSLPIDRFPPLDFPVVVISVPWSGASPEAVEAEITRPIEDAVSTIAGIESLSSTSALGHSSTMILFTLETDSRQAAQDVRDRMASVLPDLPDSADAPQVVRFNPLNDPVLSLAISGGPNDPGHTTRIAKDVILPELTSVDGVGSATLVGATEGQVEVLVDPARLRAHDIGVATIVEAIRQGSQLTTAGSVENRVTSNPVQLNAAAASPAALADLIIARPGAAALRLADVAQVTAATADPDSLAFHNGTPALAIDVIRVDGANVIAVAAGVEAAIARLNDGLLPQGMRVDILLNSATEIRTIYETMRATLIEGVALAVLIVFVFLNSWRSTLITALTLPISFLGTLAVLRLLGFSLNMLSMLALTLSVGILIDDAIIVRENITRHLHMGKSHARAALDGTREIGLAVLATTLALCAVFLPLAFMDGIIGRMFVQFGVTVAVAVLISMFVSFTLDPMLSAVWFDPDSGPGVRRGPLGRLILRFDRGFDRLTRLYRRQLGWCLRWRVTTMGFAVAVLAGSLALTPLIGTEFLPQTDESRIDIAVKTPVGSSRDYTALKTQQITGLLLDLPEVAGTYTTVAAGSGTASNEAVMVVTLVPPAGREPAAELVPVFRRLLAQIPGAELTIQAAGGVGPDDAPVTLIISGTDPATLNDAVTRIPAAVAAVPGTVDLRLSSGEAWPMTDFVPLPDAVSDLGLSAGPIGAALRTMLDGQEAGDLKWQDGRIEPIMLRLPRPLRETAGALETLPIARAGGRLISLDEITRRVETTGPTRIERRDRIRSVTLTAGLEGRILGDAMAEIGAAIAALDLPPAIRVSAGGDADLMGDTMSDMVMALGLAVVFIYLVLASQFGSFLQPFAIMVSLPLAFAGVVPGLMVAGSTLNLYSMIGIVMLMGLVVKNAILLVDNANQHSRTGMALHEALLLAGETRFRPIMMTTLAMILGMAPLALAIHPGSEQSAPMAQAVIGGLISSTLLTLVVVPVVLTWIAAAPALLRRLSAKASPSRIQPET